MKDSYIFYRDKLNAEYKAVFEQVELYVSLQTVDETTREERMGDLLDIFLSAQDAGKPVSVIVGNNIARFCKTFCSDFGVKNRLLLILDWLKSTAWLFAVISLLELIFALGDATDVDSFDFWNCVGGLSLASYFVAAAISTCFMILANLLLSHIMLRTKRVSMRIFRIVTWSVAGASFVLAMWIFWCADVPELNIPVWIVTVASCLYLAVYYLFFGKRTKRRKVGLFELVGEETLQELDKTMQKKLSRINQKRAKKGQEPLPMEDFLAQEEVSCNRTEKIKLFYIIFPLIATISFCSASWQESRNVFELIFCGLFMLGLEYWVMWGIWKIIKTGLRMRRAWADIKRQELCLLRMNRDEMDMKRQELSQGESDRTER